MVNEVEFEFRRLELSKQDLKRLPAVHLNFMASVNVAQNEANFSLRSLLSSIPSNLDGGGTFREYCAVHYLIATRRLASNVLEYIELIQKYCNKIALEGGDVNGVELTFHRSKLNIIRKDPYYEFVRRMRNKITYHYDQDYAADNLELFSDDHQFSFLLNQFVGNSLAPFAEEIGFFGLLANEKSRSNLTPEGLEQWSKRATGELRSSYDRFMLFLLRNYFSDKVLQQETIMIDDELTFSGRKPFGFVLVIQN